VGRGHTVVSELQVKTTKREEGKWLVSIWLRGYEKKEEGLQEEEGSLSKRRKKNHLEKGKKGRAILY